MSNLLFPALCQSCMSWARISVTTFLLTFLELIDLQMTRVRFRMDRSGSMCHGSISACPERTRMDTTTRTPLFQRLWMSMGVSRLRVRA